MVMVIKITKMMITIMMKRMMRMSRNMTMITEMIIEIDQSGNVSYRLSCWSLILH